MNSTDNEVLVSPTSPDSSTAAALSNSGLSAKLMSLVLKPDPLIVSVRGNRGLVLAHIDIQSPPVSGITSNCSTPLPTPTIPIATDHRPSSRAYVYDQQQKNPSSSATEFYGTGELQRTTTRNASINQQQQLLPSASSTVVNNNTVAQIIPCSFFPVLDEDSRFALFSNTGRFFVYYTAHGIRFLDVDARVHLPFASLHADSVKVRRAAFSPRDTYLVLWDTQQMSEQQTACKIYRTDTLEIVGRFIQFQRPEWIITWSADEQLMVRQSGGEIWFHETAGYLTKNVYEEQQTSSSTVPAAAKKQLPHSIRLDSAEMHIKGSISISPYACNSADSSSSSLSYFVAMFHQASRDGRGSGFIRIYKYPNIEKPQQAVQQRVVQQQDHVQFAWNSHGTHCLAQAWAETDVTSKNYYGAIQLIVFQVAPAAAGVGDLALMPPPSAAAAAVTTKHATANGKSTLTAKMHANAPKLAEPFTLQFKKDGPIHAFKWFPGRGDAFVVTYGNMPTITGLFDCSGNELYTFATNGYTNGILFNPFGNILCLYGSGNVQPTLAFWDTTKWRQPKALTRSASTVSGENVIRIDDMTFVQWAPDGIHLVTATTTPRLRINNGFKIVHFASGQVLAESAYRDGELYQVQFRPQPDTFRAPNVKREARVGALMLEAKHADAAAAATMMMGENGSGDSGNANEVIPPNSTVNSNAPPTRPAHAPGVGVKAAYVPPHMRKAGVLASAPRYLNVVDAASNSSVLPVGVDGASKAKPVVGLPPGVAKAAGKTATRPPRVPIGMVTNNTNNNGAAGGGGGGGGGGGQAKKVKKPKAKGAAAPATAAAAAAAPVL